LYRSTVVAAPIRGATTERTASDIGHMYPQKICGAIRFCFFRRNVTLYSPHPADSPLSTPSGWSSTNIAQFDLLSHCTFPFTTRIPTARAQRGSRGHHQEGVAFLRMSCSIDLSARIAADRHEMHHALTDRRMHGRLLRSGSMCSGCAWVYSAATRTSTIEPACHLPHHNVRPPVWTCDDPCSER